MKNGPYILIIPPNNYPGKRYRERYAYEHHVVYWTHFGLLPKSDELIHHKNHKKTDNRIENLELTNIRAHNKHHSKGISFIDLKCFKCDKEFRREKRNYNFKKKHQSRFFCSRSCQISIRSKEYWAKMRRA